MRSPIALLMGILLYCGAALPGLADEAPSPKTAKQALRKAVDFFRTKVAVQGGYGYRCSEDLRFREGEELLTPTQVWIEPPGTPAVGLAYLQAYESTSDPYYLDAAKETASALVRGQLRSGGWDERIEFDPKLRPRYAYRVDDPKQGARRQHNSSTLDDNKTQACVRFLMQLDKTLGFEDAAIHEATEHALQSLLKVQYPNGAWPQQFEAPPDPAQFPVKKASYPDDWPRTFPKIKYTGFYTLNDDTIVDTIDVMLEAASVYSESQYQAAALKGGDFLILAQMPPPQPAWAQQYDVEMHPVWARKFEPPAITGSESQRVLRALLNLYQQTGERRFLKPVPPALAYLRTCRLPDGQLARFYELKTNKPLYFTKDYRLTESDDDLPTHYGFKIGDGTERIAQEYERLFLYGRPKPRQGDKPSRPRVTDTLVSRANAAIDSLDKQGRWVENGRLRAHGENAVDRIIDTATFLKNIGALSNYLAATKE